MSAASSPGVVRKDHPMMVVLFTALVVLPLILLVVDLVRGGAPRQSPHRSR